MALKKHVKAYLLGLLSGITLSVGVGTVKSHSNLDGNIVNLKQYIIDLENYNEIKKLCETRNYVNVEKDYIIAKNNQKYYKVVNLTQDENERVCYTYGLVNLTTKEEEVPIGIYRSISKEEQIIENIPYRTVRKIDNSEGLLNMNDFSYTQTKEAPVKNAVVLKELIDNYVEISTETTTLITTTTTVKQDDTKEKLGEVLENLSPSQIESYYSLKQQGYSDEQILQGYLLYQDMQKQGLSDNEIHNNESNKTLTKHK